MIALMVVFSLAIVSAASNFTVSPNGALLTQANSQATMTISGTAAYSATMISTITDDNGLNINPNVAVNGQTITITESGNVDYDLGLTFGFVYMGNLRISETANASNNRTVQVMYMKTFCEGGALNDSDMKINVDINNRGEGEDDEWKLLDRIQIEVEFENTGNEDLDDIMIEIGLIDEDGNDVADDLDWISNDEEKTKIGDVNDGKDETYEFEFKVSNEFDEGDYALMVKAYPKGDEDQACIDYSTDLSGVYFEEIAIERENDDDRQVVFENIIVDPISTPCGQEVTVTATAYNIGETDQDAVKLMIYSKDLNVDEYRVIEDFDMDDSITTEFSIFIPRNISEGDYELKLFSRYDYDEDDDDDDNDELTYKDQYFDEQSEVEKITITAEGQCVGSGVTEVEIDAQLSDDTPKAIIGRQVVLEVTLENTGNVDTTYDVSVLGVSSWADVADIDPSQVTIGAGDEETVTIYLDIDSDADAGDEEFTIKASGAGEVTEQKVLLTLEEGWAAGIITNNLRNNWFIYLVILVNVILVIAIIIVIARMVGKRNSQRD